MLITPPNPNVALVSRHYENFIDRRDLSAADRDCILNLSTTPPARYPGWTAQREGLDL
jgi:hypothetical protein